MSRHRDLRWYARILVALALVATAACGVRLSDEQLAALEASEASSSREGATSANRGTGGSDTGTGAATDPGAQATGGTGGTTPGGGGGGGTEGGGGGGAGGPCTAAPTDAPGVTDTEIKIGWVGTLSGPIPNFSRTAQNGVRAYFAYINATQGGVCGRQLSLLTADDRLDAGVNRSETQRLADQVLAFAGGLSVVDDGGAAVLASTNIPDVGLSITDNRVTMPNNFSPNPIRLAAGNGIAPMLEHFKSAYGITKAAIVYPAQVTARARALNYKADFEQVGIPVVQENEVAITETNYQGVASAIKNAGADIVITTLEVNGMARLAQAFRQVGYTPKVPFYGAQAYGKNFISQAGPAAEGTVLGLAYAMLEDADSNPGMAAFAEWYPRVNPGADIDFFAIESWAAGHLLVQGLQAAGGAPTRDSVLAALSSITDFDAGGVLAPHTNPAGKQPSPCYLVAVVQGGQWQHAHPSSGFAC